MVRLTLSQEVSYVYWQDEGMWLGYLLEYPGSWTQGESEQELCDNLINIYHELTSGS